MDDISPTPPRAPSPSSELTSQARAFALPFRPELERFQERVAHLRALFLRHRGKIDRAALVGELLQDIANFKHAFRTELQNQPVAVRREGAIRDIRRALDSAEQRAHALLETDRPDLLR